MLAGAMHTDQDHEVWEFSNPNFQRDKPALLALLSRKKTTKDDSDLLPTDLSSLSFDIDSLKRSQQTLTNTLDAVQKENTQLWRECGGLRQKYQKQTQTVNKILRFLASCHHSSVQAVPQSIAQGPLKRRFILSDDIQSTSNPHQLTQAESNKRLLLMSADLPKLPYDSPLQTVDITRHDAPHKRIQSDSFFHTPTQDYTSVDDFMRYTDSDSDPKHPSQEEQAEREMEELLAYMQPALDRHERALEVLDTDTFKAGCGVRQQVDKPVGLLTGFESPSAFLDLKGSESDSFQDFFSGMLEL